MHEVNSMSDNKVNKKTQEQAQEQMERNTFNSITKKKTPENQNQQHNVRNEGLGPINQKR